MRSTVRLDRFLANLGYGSRREVTQMVRAGVVALDGVTLSDAETRIEPVAGIEQHLSIHGAPVDPAPGLVLMMHKPLGVTCSHKEAGGLVYDLLPSRWRRRQPGIQTVGRLDKDTSGLLFLTDDGALLHRMISPRSALQKRYLAALDRPLEGDEAERFAAGDLLLEGEDRPLLPAQLEPLTERTAWLTLTEGRYHQVRRMFAAVGNHVVALHRDRIGALELPDRLAPGQYEILDATALASALRNPQD
jgi:16S rRNA pseudouridine516 synthase